MGYVPTTPLQTNNGADFMNVKIETWLTHDIRFIEIKGEWWAVAKDVADALDYSETEKMTRRLKSKYVSKIKPPKTGDLKSRNDMTVLSEFGIYKAVLNSHKPEAEAFEEWVFNIIKKLRQSIGLEAFEAFLMTDKEIQKELMSLFEPKDKRDYMIINKMANSLVCKKHGLDYLKKDEMPSNLLKERQDILRSLVSVANMTGSKGEANKLVKKILEIT